MRWKRNNPAAARIVNWQVIGARVHQVNASIGSAQLQTAGAGSYSARRASRKFTDRLCSGAVGDNNEHRLRVAHLQVGEVYHRGIVATEGGKGWGLAAPGEGKHRAIVSQPAGLGKAGLARLGWGRPGCAEDWRGTGPTRDWRGTRRARGHQLAQGGVEHNCALR